MGSRAQARAARRCPGSGPSRSSRWRRSCQAQCLVRPRQVGVADGAELAVEFVQQLREAVLLLRTSNRCADEARLPTAPCPVRLHGGWRRPARPEGSLRSSESYQNHAGGLVASAGSNGGSARGLCRRLGAGGRGAPGGSARGRGFAVGGFAVHVPAAGGSARAGLRTSSAAPVSCRASGQYFCGAARGSPGSVRGSAGTRCGTGVGRPTASCSAPARRPVASSRHCRSRRPRPPARSPVPCSPGGAAPRARAGRAPRPTTLAPRS